MINQDVKTNFESIFEKRVDSVESFGPYLSKGKILAFNFFMEDINDDIKVVIEAYSFNKIILFNVKNQRTISFDYSDQN